MQSVGNFFTTYDLASRGKDVTDKNQCYGEWNETTNTSWGPAYQYPCIHSGSNEYSGGDTVWYNYAIASAGTIYDENTTEQNPANNTSPATESICPKGWTLPSKTQVINVAGTSASAGSSTYVSIFSPVLGGYYSKGTLNSKDTSGMWWGSTASDGIRRNYLRYDGTSLISKNNYRLFGRYIRCVQAS